MKTFLAALAAGILGGGAAIGAIALDLVPLQQTQQTARVAPVETGDDFEDATESDGDLMAQVRELETEIEALNAKLENRPTDDASSELDALRAEIAELKKSQSSIPAPAGEGSESVADTDAPAVTEEFDEAVRAVIDRMQEERAEERRLERQAERLERLEESKQRIGEFVPSFVDNRAEQLGIPETSKTDVSTALVTHMTFRAEILSEMEGLRIDDQEVDQEFYQQKLEDLNQTTVTALSAYVDQETAETLVNALGRAGGNNRGGRGGQRGGFRQR